MSHYLFISFYYYFYFYNLDVSTLVCEIIISHETVPLSVGVAAVKDWLLGSCRFQVNVSPPGQIKA